MDKPLMLYETEELLDELQRRGEDAFEDATDDQLADELEERGYYICDLDEAPLDTRPEVDTAASYFQRGNRAEALIWLERAMGPRFRGLGY